MPTFKVCVQRYVEETAAVMVDANTPEEAASIGEQRLADGDIDSWEEGDDVLDYDFVGGVYAVLDKDGDSVWER
jgi:hypothetical protein